MNSFGFIGHYVGLDDASQLLGWPKALRCFLPTQVIKRMIRSLPPYQFVRIDEIRSASGATVSGHGIIVPFLPEHVITWGEIHIIRKIIIGGRLANRLGAQLLGLAGFASVVGNEGEVVSNSISIPVTSGNTYTAALALQGIRKAADLMGVNLREATVAIIGATGDIGSICAKVLSKEVKAMRLAARGEQRLERFAQALRVNTACDISVTKYVSEAIRDAHIILTATSAITTLIEPADVKSGAILCDVAIPHNVGTRLLQARKDVLAFEGGLAKLPSLPRAQMKRWLQLFPDGVTIFGCLAETVLLALEGKFESYSLGRGNITTERIDVIEAIARKHGFEVAEFRYGDMRFTDTDIEKIKKHACANVI